MQVRPSDGSSTWYAVPSKIRDRTLLRERRQVVVTVAIELFARRGFHQTSVDDIAEAAGITIGSLYKYIRSKQDLLWLMAEYQTEVVEAALEEWSKDGVEPRAALEGAIESHIRAIDAGHRIAVILYREGHQLEGGARDALVAAIERVRSYFVMFLQRTIEVTGNLNDLDDRTVMAIADNLIVVTHMWAVNHNVYSRYLTVDDFVVVQTRLILHQLGISPDAPKRRPRRTAGRST